MHWTGNSCINQPMLNNVAGHRTSKLCTSQSRSGHASVFVRANHLIEPIANSFISRINPNPIASTDTAVAGQYILQIYTLCVRRSKGTCKRKQLRQICYWRFVRVQTTYQTDWKNTTNFCSGRLNLLLRNASQTDNWLWRSIWLGLIKPRWRSSAFQRRVSSKFIHETRHWL